jgi:XRE family transcriptional regulator, regulator of sulfur utilization
MTEEAATNIARNIKQLRDVRGLTQQRLAVLSGVPRATWAHLESGSANPTLTVLIKVAGALQISLDELIGPPRATGRFFSAADLKVKRRGGVEMRRVLPDAVPHLEVDRFFFPAGARMTGAPHTPGTREYLICESGRIEVSVSGETWTLQAGDVVVFRGDQRHGYRSMGTADAVAYSVVAIAPAPG